jgi:hypothetical protein
LLGRADIAPVIFWGKKKNTLRRQRTNQLVILTVVKYFEANIVVEIQSVSLD